MIKVRELLPEKTLVNGNGVNSTEKDKVDPCPKKRLKSHTNKDCTLCKSKDTDDDDVSEVPVFLESDTEALSHQIAGHTRTGVLKHKLGYVLKPFQKEPLGSREVAFYKQVFYTESSDQQQKCSKNNKLLQTLLPKFYGVGRIQSIDEEKGPIWKQYLALEDILDGFAYPCVVDIKIGAQTWDPYAPPAKVEHEKSKYKGTKELLGLSLAGMQYYDLNSKQSKRSEKDFGKSLVESSFIETLMEFLNRAYDNRVAEIIAKKLVIRLKDFQEYFELQRDFHFYSSSILIAYDAKKFDSFDKNSKPLDVEEIFKDDDVDVSSWLRVSMIDFAHVFPSDGAQPDTNYLFGLKNLVKILQSLTSLKRSS